LKLVAVLAELGPIGVGLIDVVLEAEGKIILAMLAQLLDGFGSGVAWH
jgi:hypothetical protein